MHYFHFLFIINMLLCTQCQQANNSASGQQANNSSSQVKKTEQHQHKIKTDSLIPSSFDHFPWLEAYQQNSSLANQIQVPESYRRLPCSPNSFTAWLRALPLLPEGSPVLLYNGQKKAYQQGACRVLNIDIGKRDLQQCADAVMRLRAEYLLETKQLDQLHFNYTSGHSIAFDDWAKGRKPKVAGGKVVFSAANSTADYSYKNFKKYMINVFSYAGTASLSKELKTSDMQHIQAGDVFIKGGFPGHAVIVIDVAEHIQSGKKIFLLAQSYMPAQSIHILHNPAKDFNSPWYEEDFGAQLVTPEWTFDRYTLKKFP